MPAKFLWMPILGLAFAGAATSAAEPPIGRDDLATLHSLIKPHTGEAPWSEILWLTDVWEARKRAAAEGKPIFAWLPAGEPLGCT
jgi:hypothetical protein